MSYDCFLTVQFAGVNRHLADQYPHVVPLALPLLPTAAAVSETYLVEIT